MFYDIVLVSAYLLLVLSLSFGLEDQLQKFHLRMASTVSVEGFWLNINHSCVSGNRVYRHVEGLKLYRSYKY